MKALRILTFGLVLCATIMALSGCTTTDSSENVSTRPWGYVRGYDPGLPSSMNDGR